eukprot:m.330660 g.330660  ORF g.330660 m.330660 type:complete len:221 (+) comp55612_c0_seq9:511-1173(+)
MLNTSYLRYQGMQFCQERRIRIKSRFLPHVLVEYDVPRLTREAVSILSSMQQLLLLSNVPDKEDVSTFTYWLCGNIPATDDIRISLLSIDCVNLRLHRVVELLKAFCHSRITCAECGVGISFAAEAFCRSTDGLLSAFVNPAGFVHQMFTVKTCTDAIRPVGRSSVKDTWFPGFSWTIIYCECGMHLGWWFRTAGQDTEPLDQFYGLRRSSVVTQATVAV